jgi:hypothetical protein
VYPTQHNNNNNKNRELEKNLIPVIPVLKSNIFAKILGDWTIEYLFALEAARCKRHLDVFKELISFTCLI